MQFWVWFSCSVLVNERFGSISSELIKTIRMRPNAAKKITSFMKVNFAYIPQLPKSSGLAKFFGYVLQTVSRLLFSSLNSIFTVFTGAGELRFSFSVAAANVANCKIKV